jgi:hypothetical protein
MLPHVCKKLEDVGAPHGGIVESRRAGIPVRQISAAAHLPFVALLADWRERDAVMNQLMNQR